MLSVLIFEMLKLTAGNKREVKVNVHPLLFKNYKSRWFIKTNIINYLAISLDLTYKSIDDSTTGEALISYQ